MLGRKKIETRSTRTTRRGRVAIHAATTMGRAEREAAIREGLDPDALPRGVIVGTADIVDAIPAEELRNLSSQERRCGDYRPGRWGWILGDVRPLAKPVPAAGALSFWRMSMPVEQAVEEQTSSVVFVYGTLKRGHGNHRLLEAGGARLLGTDSIKGWSMHDLGAFPAVAEGWDTVHGEVFEVDAETLARLDRLEGIPSFYQRTVGRGQAGYGADYGIVFLTDSKVHDRPGEDARRAAAEAEDQAAAEREAALDQEALRRIEATSNRAAARAATAAQDAPFEQIKTSLRAGILAVSAPQLFPTPAPLAAKLARAAGPMDPSHRVLEPSAGTGAIWRELWGCRTAVEINHALAERLRGMCTQRDFVIEADFLEKTADDLGGPFDRIVMNPPFVRGSDVEHIRHALTMLAPEGRLVALCAGGPRQKAALAPLGRWEDLPEGSFSEQGTNVRVAMLVVDAPAAEGVKAWAS